MYVHTREWDIRPRFNGVKIKSSFIINNFVLSLLIDEVTFIRKVNRNVYNAGKM